MTVPESPNWPDTPAGNALASQYKATLEVWTRLSGCFDAHSKKLSEVQALRKKILKGASRIPMREYGELGKSLEEETAALTSLRDKFRGLEGEVTGHVARLIDLFIDLKAVQPESAQAGMRVVRTLVREAHVFMSVETMTRLAAAFPEAYHN